MLKRLAAVIVAAILNCCHMTAFGYPNYVFGLKTEHAYDVFLNDVIILQNVQPTEAGVMTFDAGSGRIRIDPTGAQGDENLIDNGGFESLPFTPPWSWQNSTGGGAFTQTSDHHSGGFAAKVTVAVAGEFWSTQIRQDGITLVDGEQYKLRLAIKCTNARTVTIGVVDPLTGASMGYWQDISVNGQWLVIEEPFEATASGQARLAIYMGTGTGAYTIDDVGVWHIAEDYCGDPENKLLNGSFDCDVSPIFWIAEDHHGNATFTTDTQVTHDGERSGKAIVLSAGQYYQTQWKQTIAVIQGTEYVFDAWIKADRNVPEIVAGLTDQNGASLGLWKPASIGTAWTHLQVVFVAEASCAEARFSFYLGATAASYWIDEASITSSEGHPSSVAEAPISQLALTVSPNPVDTSAVCRFTLRNRSDVSVSVYDVAGRKVQQLAETNLASGVQSIPWVPSALSAGVYFVRLTTPYASETERVLVVR